MTIVGTRPEIIRLSRVISSLEDKMDHVLVHTGQNYDYELNDIFFKDLEIKKPDYFLKVSDKNTTAAEAIGNVLIKIDPIIRKELPDAVLILGDTNSCLAAIAAKRQKIPVFHMEAGNRCFDQRVPEEINRKIIDSISDINLPYSHIAREYLANEGFPIDRIIKTGSPMLEVIEYYRKKIEGSKILQRFKLKAHNYFLVSSHREENIDSDINFNKLIIILNELGKRYKKPIIVSMHPRTRKRLNQKKVKLNKKVQILKPLSYSDYIKLQVNAYAVLSDSGTITEESSILNFPALNIREAHERPEGMEEAAVILTGLNIKRVLQALKIAVQQARNKKRLFKIAPDYKTDNISEKLPRIIISYIDYVNNNVWHKGEGSK